MIKGQEMNIALGLPVYVSGFSDGVPRRCFPYKLKDLYKLNSYLSFINGENFNKNLETAESLASIKALFEESFVEYVNDNPENEIFKFINEFNFVDIFDDIKTINGLTKEAEKEIVNISGNKADVDNIDWFTSIGVVMLYTSNGIEDIQNLTLQQYNHLLQSIGKQINWEYKIQTVSLTDSPNEYISEEDHPLSSPKKHKTMMTMEDLNFMDE